MTTGTKANAGLVTEGGNEVRGRNLTLAAKVAGSGMPAYQVAAKSGMTPSRFSWILNGRSLPTEKEQQAIARALKTVKESLFDA